MAVSPTALPTTPFVPPERLESFNGDDIHVVLLGDSTLDNGRYLNLAQGELSVEKQLSKKCTERGWQMTVLAQDGAMLEDVRFGQLPLIPQGATHIIMSASGNDLLSLLNQMVAANFTLKSMYSAIGSGLNSVSEQYQSLVQDLKKLGCHLACCTLYSPNFNHIFFKSLATFSLRLHNNRIKQISQEQDCSIIDFANLLETPDDFANALELNTRGGSKVVENIAAFVSDFPSSRLHRRSPNIYADDEAFLPDAMVNHFGLPLQCCVTRAPQRKVYVSKVVPTSLLVPDISLADNKFGPALAFSEKQEHWRDPSEHPPAPIVPDTRIKT